MLLDEKNIKKVKYSRDVTTGGNKCCEVTGTVWTKVTGRQLCIGSAGWAESVEGGEQSCFSWCEVLSTRAELQDMAGQSVTAVPWASHPKSVFEQLGLEPAHFGLIRQFM